MAERASDSEMQVLAALWDDSPQTAADLATRIGAANGWTLATVKTLLARLVHKGAVAAEAEGATFSLSPRGRTGRCRGRRIAALCRSAIRRQGQPNDRPSC